jgi:phosphoribosylformimino-5-aminoimidazole carboxamide ribotide isomerase
MGGKCVRLTQGKREQCTVYSDRPQEMASRWIGDGAKWLHVVDLDAAIDCCCFANRKSVQAIVAAADGVPVQVGGGVREAAHIRGYLEDGVARVIVGTSVLESREFAREIFSEFGERVAVSIDSSNGIVAVKGWTGMSDLKTIDAVKRMKEDGASTIILTDIRRDGMLTEPNYEMMADVADAVDLPLICAGGVSAVSHLDRLNELNRKNISGAIIGKALYSGDFDLREAIKRFPQ